MPEDPIDIHIGRRIASARLARDMTLQRLGEELGVSYQQVRKYERGINRVAASTLQRLSTILNVPPRYFYEGIALEDDSPLPDADPGLVDILQRIGDDEVRQKLAELIAILSK